MKRVYISSPYSNGDPVVNVKRAIYIAEEVWTLGFIPYLPHLNHFWHSILPHSWEDWLELDLAWLEKCDIILRLDGDSKGADLEVKEAQRLGIPIAYSIEELKEVKMKPECPNLIKHAGYSKELDEYCEDYRCDLNDKWCLKEHGSDCETYQEWLREYEIEKLAT